MMLLADGNTVLPLRMSNTLRLLKTKLKHPYLSINNVMSALDNAFSRHQVYAAVSSTSEEKLHP